MSSVVGSRQAKNIFGHSLHEMWKGDKLQLPWEMMPRWKKESSEGQFIAAGGEQTPIHHSEQA